MDEQVDHEQHQIVLVWKVIREIVTHFFDDRNDSFDMHAKVAVALSTLKQEREKRSLATKSQLKDLRKVVLAQHNQALSSSEEELNIGKAMLMLLI